MLYVLCFYFFSFTLCSLLFAFLAGGMAEWSMAAVLKTVSPKGDVGSNPTPSAKKYYNWTQMNADFQEKKIEKELRENKAQSICCPKFFNLVFSA
jgi:hypothetical protein